jgi:hypothetical protein
MILRCTCKNKYQDEKHGPGMRVHNIVPPKKGVSEVLYRCTICGQTKGK